MRFERHRKKMFFLKPPIMHQPYTTPLATLATPKLPVPAQALASTKTHGAGRKKKIPREIIPPVSQQITMFQVVKVGFRRSPRQA